MATRYRFTVEYDGTPYVGWQRQDNGASVQQAIEDALERLTGVATSVSAAGRTDAGVHALGQVIHCDLAEAWEPFRLASALNFHLKPQPIAILAAEVAAADFHARFQATARRYCYQIVNRRAPLALDRNRALAVTRPLDEGAMAEAARLLLGRHDFSSFRAALCQAKSPVKTLSELTVERRDDRLRIAAFAPSFLHHQVRNIVGTLLLVGLGRWQPARVGAALAACDRAAAGPTAPAHGLYFVEALYAKNRSSTDR